MPTLNEQRNRLHNESKMHHGYYLFKTFFANEQKLAIMLLIEDKIEGSPFSQLLLKALLIRDLPMIEWLAATTEPEFRSDAAKPSDATRTSCLRR